MLSSTPHPASFRDPSGFVFLHKGQHFRYIAESYAEDYYQLMSSGLYNRLVGKGYLLSHSEIDKSLTDYPNAWKIILPDQVQYWSYPYEWSFSQLKEAALLTLLINIEALKDGMILKDATAYNIQFRHGKPIFIDSLSFEKHEDGAPWAGFRQFCQHFLYPLLLQHYSTPYRPGWLTQYPDGIPASVAKALLPTRSRLSLFNYLYVYLPARVKKENSTGSDATRKLPPNAVYNNLRHLFQAITKLKPVENVSHWSTYYSTTILNESYLVHKQKVVGEILLKVKPHSVVDIGCNTGIFTLLAAKYATHVTAIDSDPQSICNLFNGAQKENIGHILPLVASITNPSPSLGWANREHCDLLSRIKSDVVLALALIHHLALTDNIPLPRIIELFATICRHYLIIEFIPKADPMAQLLLKNKNDIFYNYTTEDFEREVVQYFTIIKRTALNGSVRVLYLLVKKQI